MITRSFILACGAFLFAGCSASGSSPPGGTTTTVQGVECTPGNLSCFCPDGTSSGTQTCDEQHVLSPCICPQTIDSTPITTPTTTPTKVCSSLQGQGACSASSYVSKEVPSSVLFLLDRSGSMACNAPPVQTTAACNANPVRAEANQPSKWEITTKALNSAFAGLSGSTASIGLSIFSTDGYCGVDSTPIAELAPTSAVQLQTLTNAMAGFGPAGGTPIVGGTILAYHHLHQDVHASGNRYVVLITDGEEDCGTKGDSNDTADLKAAEAQLLNVEVEKARDANIKTFVVGVPGSETNRGFLSQLAYAGGTGAPNCIHDGSANSNCHFDLTTQSDFAGVLKDALGKISGKALGCEFQTPSGSSTLVNVQYSVAGKDPVCFPEDTTKPCDSGANGWQYAKDASGKDDPSRVVLCGAACDAVKADPTTVVDVVLGCQSIQ